MAPQITATGNDPLLGQLLAQPGSSLCPQRSEAAGKSTSYPVDGCSTVLVDRTETREFDRLAAMLRKLGVPCVRISYDALPHVHAEHGSHGSHLEINGTRILPGVFWKRHLDLRSFPTHSHHAVTLFNADSWFHLLHQLGNFCCSSLPGDSPPRLSQLREAALLGFNVPKTIVTTDPRTALDHLPVHRLIAKATHEHYVQTAPGVFAEAKPEVVAREKAKSWRPLNTPIILQEYIAHDSMLRVYYFNGDFVAFNLPALPGTNNSVVSRPETVTVADLDDRAQQRIHALAGHLGIRYGAFDLLVADGQLTFLEVNVDGDWCWFETRAGTRLATSAACRMVLRLLPPAQQEAAGAQFGPIDLLTLPYAEE